MTIAISRLSAADFYVTIKMKGGKAMFDNPRYLTRGVHETIPLELQLFLWDCIDRMPEPKDYFQIFELNDIDGMQHIVHSSEQPEYTMNYFIPTLNAVSAKIYVIDSEEYSTMLLAEEY